MPTSPGSIYEGGFENGMKDGKGKFKVANGDCSEGRWIRDEFRPDVTVATFACGDTVISCPIEWLCLRVVANS